MRISKAIASAMILLALPVNAYASVDLESPRVIGYLPDWNYQGYKDLNMSYLTTINIAFCNPDSNGKLSCDIPDKELKHIVSTAHENGAEVFAALGGAGSCEVYLQHIDTPDEIAEFDKEIIEYCEKYELDGIDLDIELGSYHQIWSYYSDWCSDLRIRCDDHSLKMSTATAHWVAEKVTPETFALFDFINVMAYDNDEDEKSHSTYEYAEECLSYFSNVKKIPSEKLVLGVPFYGRGYNSQGKLDWNSYESFASLVKKDETNYNHDYYNGIAYNGSETIAKKAELGKKYGGIMIWELTQDAKGDKSLLNVIHKTIGTTDLPLIGDVNDDGTVNSADLVTLNRWILGDKNASIPNWEAGDICKDGIIDSFDLIAMRRVVLERSEIS